MILRKHRRGSTKRSRRVLKILRDATWRLHHRSIRGSYRRRIKRR